MMKHHWAGMIKVSPPQTLLLLSGSVFLLALTLTLSPGKFFLVHYPLWPYLKWMLESVSSMPRCSFHGSMVPWKSLQSSDLFASGQFHTPVTISKFYPGSSSLAFLISQLLSGPISLFLSLVVSTLTSSKTQTWAGGCTLTLIFPISLTSLFPCRVLPRVLWERLWAAILFSSLCSCRGS